MELGASGWCQLELDRQSRCSWDTGDSIPQSQPTNLGALTTTMPMEGAQHLAEALGLSQWMTHQTAGGPDNVRLPGAQVFFCSEVTWPDSVCMRLQCLAELQEPTTQSWPCLGPQIWQPPWQRT